MSTTDALRAPLTGSWVEHAACRGADPELFFPIGMPSREVLAICAACPVREDCLSAALRRAERGIWGGTTEDQRRRIRAGQQQRPMTIDSSTGEDVTVHPITENTDPSGDEPVGILNLETLLRHGEGSETAATRAAAKRARAAVEDLRERVNTEAAEKKVRERINGLQEQLATAEEELRRIRPPRKSATPRGSSVPDGVNSKDIRAWAAEHGITCPGHGRIPKAVVDQYLSAHGLADAS